MYVILTMAQIAALTIRQMCETASRVIAPRMQRTGGWYSSEGTVSPSSFA